MELFDSRAFRNINCLEIEADEKCLTTTLHRCFILIDKYQSCEVWLSKGANKQIQFDPIESLLQQATNTQILGTVSHNDFESRIVELDSVVSSRVDHLELKVDNVYCMKLRFKYIRGVSTIAVQQNEVSHLLFMGMVNWLERKQ